MAESVQSQIEKLHLSIDGLEAQRILLGDNIVDPALTALKRQLADLEEQAAALALPVEERRLVTILFFDMVGSTDLADKLDPEEWRQVVKKMHRALGKAVAAHRGTVAQYLGDGLLAYFGAKEASEDDPENAIRAALDGLTATANLNLPEIVQLRAGIHSGLVVVGEFGEEAHKEFTASGDAVNLAARLQSAAPPGGILISHDTYRYVRGVFDMTPRPPLSVKGKSELLQAYLVRRAKPRPFRSVSRGVAGVETRTIGRDAEKQLLEDAYLKAYAGHGVVWAQLVSDPGVGKSRLVVDLSDWIDLREETTRLLRARAFPDDTNQPFALVRRLWFDRFQIAEDTPLEQAEAKWVERFKEFSGQDGWEEAAHALGLLAGLTFENSPHIKAMRNDPTQVKGRALVVSRELLDSVRFNYPVVVLLEDLQWTDLASWDYLMEVFLGGPEGEQPNGLFVLGAARPEWKPPVELSALFSSSLSPKTKLKESDVEDSDLEQSELKKSEYRTWGVKLTLAPLTDESMRELAKEIFQQVEEIPGQVLDLLVERAEGVPYFAEEIVNWFIDHCILDTRGELWHFLPEKLKEQPLPVTLQHMLLTRLGSLTADERSTLQRGAIFGRRFWTGGVEALGAAYSGEVLGHLQPRGFVEAQPESAFQGDTEWSFHHTLLQEVTYESILKRERAALHSVAAGWLEQQARQAGRLDEFAGLLGDHYERAGELSAAADWYLRAGRRTMSQGAPRQARDFYAQALELIPPVDRQRRWLTLLGLEEALGVLGDADPWKACIASMLELARTIEDDNYLAEAYLRQAVYGMRSEDEQVIEPAYRAALDAARCCGNEPIEIKALALSAVEEVNRGDKSASIDHIENALRLARRLDEKNVLAFVLFRGAYCYAFLGNFERWFTLQNEQIELDCQLGNRSDEAHGMGNLGHGYAWLGQYKQARSLIEQARKTNEAMGARRALAYNYITLGFINLVTGDLRNARQWMDKALQEISPSQDIRGKIMIFLVLGYIQLEMGDGSGAHRRFIEAHDLAVSQELTTAVSETMAGLAASAILLGQLDQAREYVQKTWDYLAEHGWVGMSFPEKAFRLCAETYDALGEIETTRMVIEKSYQVLMELADTISVPEWRQSFLENEPDHRTIVEMWERRKIVNQ